MREGSWAEDRRSSLPSIAARQDSRIDRGTRVECAVGRCLACLRALDLRAVPGLVQIGKPRPQGGAFLPTTLAEARQRGWDDLDVVLVNGDAYVDHPTFGAPLIGRLLASHGFRVGIISQPRCKQWRTR